MNSACPTSRITRGSSPTAACPTPRTPAELEHVDVAIVGLRQTTSSRSSGNTPRSTRNSCRELPPRPHLGAKSDAFAELSVVDFGDAAVVPADPERILERIEHTVGQVVAAGAVPVVLGGDHSITEPNVHAVATRHRPVGLVHFETHTDTGNEGFGAERSHGTPMYRLVRDRLVDGSRYIQIGLSGTGLGRPSRRIG